MKVLKVLDAEILLADIEVNLGKQVRHAKTLCVRYDGQIIPLNTPDMRPILMKEENAIADIGENKNMIKWIKNKIKELKYKRRVNKKLKKLKEQDPFIYD